VSFASKNRKEGAEANIFFELPPAREKMTQAPFAEEWKHCCSSLRRLAES
jgi:hypothetical protein